MWAWPTTGAVCGLAGGVIAVAFGTLLLTIAWVTGDESSGLSLHGVGSILLLSTIPLLILGACCLDLVEKLEKNQQSTLKHSERGARLINRKRHDCQIHSAGGGWASYQSAWLKKRGR